PYRRVPPLRGAILPRGGAPLLPQHAFSSPLRCACVLLLPRSACAAPPRRGALPPRRPAPLLAGADPLPGSRRDGEFLHLPCAHPAARERVSRAPSRSARAACCRARGRRAPPAPPPVPPGGARAGG